MAERQRIARYFAPLAQAESGSFDLTDDAASLTPPPGQQLVITTDSVIEGIHVLPEAIPQLFAQKLMRRNLSDLAAMGAKPWRYTLNVHTPKGLWDDWFAGFAIAMMEEQETFGLVLVGGDSTVGGADAPIHVTMTCFGLAEQVLRRNGAQAGDDLYVSGTIGDAALGLKLLQQKTQQNGLEFDRLVQRYHRPEPRLVLGEALHGIASSVVDISDGLFADIVQLCEASGCGAQIERAAIPISPELQHFLLADARLWDCVFQGGDDYELCFTASPFKRTRIAELEKTLGLPLTRIGSVTADTDILLLDDSHEPLPIQAGGWEYS